MPRRSPTVRRRRLAAELRRLRETSGLSLDAAAKATGLSTSTLSRIENMQSTPQVPVAKSLLELYGVTDEELTAWLQVAKEARRRGWWQPYKEVMPEWLQKFVGLESEASEIDKYELQLMPGLLQTADYARAIIKAAHPDAAEAEIARRLDLRMERQGRDLPKLWVVLDEAVIRRMVGSRDVMRGQLHRLIKAAETPGITIQIHPFSAGEHGSMGNSFTILKFSEPADPPVVYLETSAGGLYLEEERALPYPKLFTHLVAGALSPRDTLVLTRRVEREQ